MFHGETCLSANQHHRNPGLFWTVLSHAAEPLGLAQPRLADLIMRWQIEFAALAVLSPNGVASVSQ